MLELIIKDLQGRLEEKERLVLQQWRQADPMHERQYGEVREVWAATGREMDLVEPPDPVASWNRFRTKLDSRSTPKSAGKTYLVWSPNTWRIAAALAAMVAIAWFFWPSGQRQPILLTAAENKTTHLLPDGTSITLKGGSTLELDVDFGQGSSRNVRLQGHAFFDVASDPDRPFRIQAGRMDITVLGTQFYVLHRKEKGSISVTEGRVKAEDRISGRSWEMTVNQQLEWAPGPQTEPVMTSVGENDFAWHTGFLRFRDQPLGEVLDLLEDQFGVAIHLTRKELAYCRYTGQFRQEKLPDILRTLSGTFGMTLKTSPEGSYYLTGGDCR